MVFFPSVLLGLTNSGVTILKSSAAFQAEVVLKKTKGSSNKNLCETQAGSIAQPPETRIETGNGPRDKHAAMCSTGSGRHQAVSGLEQCD